MPEPLPPSFAECYGRASMMVRDYGGKEVIEADKERFDILDRRGKVFGRHGWRIHASLQRRVFPPSLETN
jgi:hypothetical protein